MRSFTFKEWKAKGYHVIKGQKATGRNKDGVATFTENQCDLNDGDEDYDADDMIGDYIYDIGDR